MNFKDGHSSGQNLNDLTPAGPQKVATEGKSPTIS